MRPALVRCHSGHSYCDRPVAFLYEGVEHEVGLVVKEWREPGLSFFLVEDMYHKRFLLCYNYRNTEWSVADPGREGDSHEAGI